MTCENYIHENPENEKCYVGIIRNNEKCKYWEAIDDDEYWLYYELSIEAASSKLF